MLIFGKGGKPENPEKNPWSKDENQQQTQPTYDAGSGNRTRDTLVGGERSHHCAIPPPRHPMPVEKDGIVEDGGLLMVLFLKWDGMESRRPVQN